MTIIHASLISFLSALIVAVVSHLLSSKRKRSDELAEFRMKAYTDFINAASRLVAARRMGIIKDEIDDLAALNDAKTRICICADVPLVEALSEFWKSGGTLEKEGEIQAFTRLCMNIRQSLGNLSTDIYYLDLPDILFKLQPSTYSFKHARDDAFSQTDNQSMTIENNKANE